MHKLLAVLLMTAAAPILAETVNDLAPYDNQIDTAFWNTTEHALVEVSVASGDSAAIDLREADEIPSDAVSRIEARRWTEGSFVIDIETLKFGLLLFVR